MKKHAFLEIRCWLGSLLGAVLWLAGATAHADFSVVELVNERLGLMREVAAYKWITATPIENLDREAIVIQDAAEVALRHGIEVSATRELFRAQISAAKELQHYWFARWASEGAPSEVRDLNDVLRPLLNTLGEQILAALATQGCCSATASDVLVTEGLSAGSRSGLLRALASVRRYQSRLEQVLKSGVLRVGTTGDYAPFSYRAGDGGLLTGIDVDLARDLAASLDAEPQFVATSWPGLLDDLQSGLYDVAMTGVSRTLARQRVGYFTHAYHQGGKTPIARCVDRLRYGSLQDIDRDDVRVIVNPGGTNERFVDANLMHADKVVHEDNRSIFAELVNGTADVMITDRIEVVLQSGVHRDVLCATMAENLTYQEKAYLLPQDGPWRSYLNAWLSERIRSGAVAESFARHLSGD